MPRECGYICSGHAVPDNAVVEQVVRQIEGGAYPVCSGHAVPDNAVVEQVVRQIEGGAYPYLVEHARQHDAGHPQTSFEFGLDLIFDGAATAARQQDVASVAILHGLRLGRARRPQTS